MIFYNSFCTRGEDRPIPLTANDVDVRVIAANSGMVPAPNTDGLVAIANRSGLRWGRLQGEAIHSRIYWFDVNETKFRVLEPIILETYDAQSCAFGFPWDPIRTGVTFWRPTRAQVMTCGRRSTWSVPGTRSRAAPTSPRRSRWAADSRRSARTSTRRPRSSSRTIPSGALTGFVYDDEERPLASINTVCNCLTTLPLAALSTVYSQQNSDTYTELVSDGSFPGFTGYKARHAQRRASRRLLRPAVERQPAGHPRSRYRVCLSNCR